MKKIRSKKLLHTLVILVMLVIGIVTFWLIRSNSHDVIDNSITKSKTKFSNNFIDPQLPNNKTLKYWDSLSKIYPATLIKTLKDIDSNMIMVIGGSFKMGSKNLEHDNPIHQVSIDNFFIGKFEITQANWFAIMENNLSEHHGCETCPVERVSWYDVQEFLKKLNTFTGKKYRLPSESEWEYAASGGIKTHGYIYSGSNNVEKVAWYTENSGGDSQPVGQKQQNELGIYDMSGNVSEWCNDWWDKIQQYRVIRGGSWNEEATYLGIANRYHYIPDDRHNPFGFRVAISY